MPANHKTTNPSKMIQLHRVPFLESGEIPTWTNIMKDSTTWKVSFDMVDDTVQLSILVMTRPALLDYIKTKGIKATGIILFICSVCTVTVTPTKFL